MAELVLDLAGTVAGVGVKTSYGETVDIDGTKIVPVALGGYGFAGGNGSGGGGKELQGEGRGGGGQELQGEGSGGGGFGVSIPLGAYVGRRDRRGQVRAEPDRAPARRDTDRPRCDTARLGHRQGLSRGDPLPQALSRTPIAEPHAAADG